MSFLSYSRLLFSRCFITSTRFVMSQNSSFYLDNSDTATRIMKSHIVLCFKCTILKLAKAGCRLLPFVAGTCEHLVDQFGPLLIKLAAQFVNRQACVFLHICPSEMPGMQ